MRSESNTQDRDRIKIGSVGMVFCVDLLKNVLAPKAKAHITRGGHGIPEGTARRRLGWLPSQPNRQGTSTGLPCACTTKLWRGPARVEPTATTQASGFRRARDHCPWTIFPKPRNGPNWLYQQYFRTAVT